MEMIGLLEEDKEQLEQSLTRCASPAKAQEVLEKQLDRMLLRYNEACSEEAVREAAAAFVQTAKTAVQMIDTAGEVSVWERRSASDADKGRGKIPMKTLACLIAGAVLVIGACLGTGVMLGGDGLASAVRALPAAIIGGVLLFLGGRFWKGQPGRDSTDTAPGDAGGQNGVMTEIHVDTGKVLNGMRAIAMVMDKNLKSVQHVLNYERDRQSREEGNEGGIPGEEAGLLAEILELSYGQHSEDPRADAPVEVISSVKYYLHRKQIDVVDYDPARRGWFELLPGNRTMTLRPALVHDGILIRKGLASTAPS